MLENKKFNIILSLILAVGLWIYVVGEVNPTAETTMNHVPITYTNVNILAERGLAVSSSSADEVDLQIKGSRSDLARITPEDIKVTADMGTAQKGENEISLQVRVPDGIEVTRKSMNKIVVTVENLKERVVPVKIVYDQPHNKESEALTLEQSSKEVTIVGAETLVNSVKEARGTVKNIDMGEAEKKIKCNLTPVDGKNNEVKRIIVNPDSVTVTAIMSNIKEVELKVPIVDNSNDGTKRTLEKPDKIFIKGRADTLKNITSVTAEPVDITGLANGEKVPLKLNLPEGITLSKKNPEILVSVKSENPAENSFKFKSSAIEMNGQLDGYTYSLPDDFVATIIISGKKEEVNKVSEGDIKLSINLSSANQEGDVKIPLTIKCNNPNVTVSVNPESAPVSIKAKVQQE